MLYVLRLVHEVCPALTECGVPGIRRNHPVPLPKVRILRQEEGVLEGDVGVDLLPPLGKILPWLWARRTLHREPGLASPLHTFLIMTPPSTLAHLQVAPLAHRAQEDSISIRGRFLKSVLRHHLQRLIKVVHRKLALAVHGVEEA